MRHEVRHDFQRLQSFSTLICFVRVHKGDFLSDANLGGSSFMGHLRSSLWKTGETMARQGVKGECPGEQNSRPCSGRTMLHPGGGEEVCAACPI